MPQVPRHHLPRPHPDGYPLAAKLAARIEHTRAEQDAGRNPLGLIFPSPRFRHWRSSNFDRRVLAPAYLIAGWRDERGAGDWTWHSLRHVFCTTALFAWKLDATIHDLLLRDPCRYSTYRDTHQPMNVALGSVLIAFGYQGAPFGSGDAWLVTGRRTRGTGAGQ